MLRSVTDQTIAALVRVLVYVKSVITKFILLIRVCFEIIVLLPALYREYRRFKPHGIHNKVKIIKRIAKLTYNHRVKPALKNSSKLGTSNHLASSIAKKAKKPKILQRKTFQNGLVFAAIAALIVSSFIPAGQTNAASLMWSSNSDFTMNAKGVCGATTTSNLDISGTAYTDTSCAATGEDAALTLKRGGIMIGDVKQVETGIGFSVILKNDGTVWSWGSNFYGFLGDNTTEAKTLPVQVKDSTGSGFLTDVKEISTGNFHTLALKNDGTVWAWGQNKVNFFNEQGVGTGGVAGGGQLGDGTTVWKPIPVKVRGTGGVGSLTNVVSISAGTHRSAAVKSDGTVWTWGANTSGTTGDGSNGGRDSSVLFPVQVKDPSGTGFFSNAMSVSTGTHPGAVDTGSHTLVLKNDGTVWSWGYNANGQLGNNALTTRTLPNQVMSPDGTGFLTNIKSVFAGGFYSVAISNDGTVFSWGKNASGQLGDGTVTDRLLPVQVKDVGGQGVLSGVLSADAGIDNAIAVKADGTVWSWGVNNYGQLGDNTTTQRNSPVQVKDTLGTGVISNISRVSSTSSHSLISSADGTVYSWGRSYYGQTGFGEQVQKPTQTTPLKLLANYQADKLSDVKEVVSGRYHSVVLKNDGTVWAWGLNVDGQLGDGSTTQRALPVQVKDSSGAGFLSNIKQLSSGGGQNGSYTLALDNDGSVWAWGSNVSGQLGIGGTLSSVLPVKVKSPTGVGFLTDIKNITASSNHALAIKNDGTVWSWGSNANGQLGDNTTTQRTLPVQVKDPAGTGYITDAVQSAAIVNSSLIIKSDGTVWGWGLNSNGQLGDNTTTQRNLPVQTKDPAGTGFLSNVAKISMSSNGIATGSVSSFALKLDGTVWAWGWNGYGQLGDATTTMRTLPIQVKDYLGTGSYLSNIVSISGSKNESAYAVDTNGNVWAWGNNGSGQLGTNNLANSNKPVQVKDYLGTGFLSQAKLITSGDSFATILKNDGTLVSLGYNNYSNLGNYSTVNQWLPVDVLSRIIFTDGHLPQATASGYVVDVGQTRRTKWFDINWTTQALPVNTSVKFNARTSSDGTNWSDWTADQVQSTAGTLGGTADLSSLPFSRFIELKITLANTDFYGTPTLNDFSLSMMNDTITPTDNASNIAMKESQNGATVAENSWNKSQIPYFSWDAGQDDIGGSEIGSYCLYLGQDNTADVITTKGLLGDSPVNTDGKCQYAVPTNTLDLASQGVLAQALLSSNSPYYLLVKALDNAGNLFDGPAASFAFKHDVTPPNNISFISLPSQFIPTKDVTVTWPTSGAQAASDINSGLAGLQYRIGATGTWYGATHNGNQDISDVLANTGSYQTNPTHDYPLLSDGNNLIYFRSIDQAGNVSASLTSAVIKINTAAPSSPQALAASPETNTLNNFSFTWQAPATFVGSAASLTYCYTVNTLPTVSTCSFTQPGQTAVGPGAFATQPGENTFYVVAKDEAGNLNYATASSVTFSANTSAPGIPLALDIADVSVKTTQSWKLALSWEEPSDTGAGVATYRVMRSLSPTEGFAQIASTSGNSFVDTRLAATTYYYKVKACDSANNCGVDTPTVNKLPTGRYTTPAEITGAPSSMAESRRATITWFTARNSDSKVQIGTEPGVYRASEVSSSVQTQEHRIAIDELEAGKTYYYKVKWTDEDGNTGSSSELSFTTLPPPVIKDIKVLKRTLNSATIQFTTTGATGVRLNFGRGEDLGGVKTINTSTAESTYTVELTDLADGTNYYYRPDAIDVSGYAYTGNVFSFATPLRPRISNLTFQPISGEPTSTQKVNWQTNVPSTSQVTYGLTGTNGDTILDTKMVTDHTVIVKNLKDSSEYFLFATSSDVDGNKAVSDRQNFRTALDTRAPKVSDVVVESSIKGTGADARGQIVVTWKTDEPATSQVAYGEGGGGTYSGATVEDGRPKTEHTVVISDLSVSTVYYLQPISRDAANNDSKSDEQSAIIGRPTDNVLSIIMNALLRTFGL